MGFEKIYHDWCPVPSRDDLRDGTRWRCDDCGRLWHIVRGVWEPLN